MQYPRVLALCALLLGQVSPIITLSLSQPSDSGLTLWYNTELFRAEIFDLGNAEDLQRRCSLFSGPASGSVSVSSASQIKSNEIGCQITVQDGGVYKILMTVENGEFVTSTIATLYVNPWPHDLPGLVQAEDANLGNSVGYVDTTPGNSGGQYTRDDDLDIEKTLDIGGGYNVGWVAKGERLSFTTLNAMGFYTVVFRVAAEYPGPKIMKLTGYDNRLLASVQFNYHSGWQSFHNVTITNVKLYGYIEQIDLEFQTDGINLNWIDFIYQGDINSVNGFHQVDYAVNCGSTTSFTNFDGTKFQADFYGTGGKFHYSNVVIDAPMNHLYKSEVYGNLLNYSIQVPTGRYALTLYFAEIYHTDIGMRVFDVSVQGNKIIQNLDLVATVGSQKAYIYTDNIDIENDTFELELQGIVGNAKISAFQVVHLCDIPSDPQYNQVHGTISGLGCPP
eukprot:m.126201 g.126201  ORF g.126201 m.126201 type:complete len:448 (+) comp14510_c1_seq4:171-1514(+)